MMMTKFNFLMLFVLTFAPGCKKGPEIVPVSGQISIDNQPLKFGGITVYVKGHRPAVANIDKDGRFSFSTKSKDDGCLVGEHIITVDCADVINETFTRHYIPEKYSKRDTSGLKIKVDKPTKDMAINLTWKGDPHKKPYDTR